MTASAGRRVGPWRLARELGAGAMGTVWLAARADGAYEGRAAVKLPRGELASPAVRAALERERAVLARLEHPGIARLLDGGTTDDGRPYLAVELVEGEPVDRWVRDRRPPLRARVELALALCDAVRHAHAALVVHRDLKPSNVLVDPGGRPRLVDFGIAGEVDAGPVVPDAGAHEARGARGAGSLAYAAPEQLAGERAGPAADVYSLGAILYELVCDRPPHALADTGPLEALRVVSEREPARPSEAAAEPALRRALRGDLDRVLLRALARDPARRYASVERLAEDLRAFLEHRPVSARPDTVGYRAGKFLRRNRISVSAFSLALAALVAAFGGSAVSLVRAERARAGEVAMRGEAEEGLARTLALGEELAEQRALAERRFVDARRFATDLIFGLRRRVDATSQATEASDLVLDAGLRFLDHLANDAPDDPKVLEELARGYLRHADVQDSRLQRSLGDTVAADASLARAQAVIERLEALEESRVLAATLRAEIEFRRGSRAISEGRFAAASARMEAALEACSGTAESEGDRFELARTRARMHASVAGQLSEVGRTDEALVHYEGASAANRELLELRPSLEPFVRGDLAFVQAQVCRLWVIAQEPERAVACGEPALEVLEELVSAHREDERVQRAYATAQASLAEAYLDVGRLEEADALLTRHLRAAEELVAVDPDDPFALELLHGNHWRRALYWERLDGLEEAVGASLACLAVGDRMLARGSADRTIGYSQSVVRQRLGALHVRGGRPDEAEEVLLRAERDLGELLAVDPGNPSFLRCAYRVRRNRARAAVTAGDVERARTLYAEALALLERIDPGARTAADVDNEAEIRAGVAGS